MSGTQVRSCAKEDKTVLRMIYEQNAERGRNNRKLGEAMEFRILRSFKNRNDVLFAIRSAGSHSAIDIVVQMKNKRQLWITCKKNGYIEPRERLALSKVASRKPNNVEIRLYYYRSEKVMCYTKLA
jgi:hypothetical protein